jgi:hypothetical protein
VIERPVGSLGKAMLGRATRPVRTEELIRLFAAAYGSDASQTLARLEDASLVFREGDCVLSLVVETGEDDERDHDVCKRGDEAAV